MQPMRLRLAALPLIVAVALAGCGGGGDDAAKRRDQREIERIYFDSAYAEFDGDGEKACVNYTGPYKAEVVKEIVSGGAGQIEGKTCERVIRNLEPLLRKYAPHPNLRISHLEISGDRASLVATIDTNFGPSRSKAFLTRVNGRWKISHDEDLGNVQQGVTASQQ
jgi:hypothetical protein